MKIRELFRRLFGRPNITTIVDDEGTTIIRDMDNSVDIVLHWDKNRHLISSEVHDARR